MQNEQDIIELSLVKGVRDWFLKGDCSSQDSGRTLYSLFVCEEEVEMVSHAIQDLKSGDLLKREGVLLEVFDNKSNALGVCKGDLVITKDSGFACRLAYQIRERITRKLLERASVLA